MRVGIRELIFFVVLLAVPVASYAYVFKPRSKEITQATSEIDQKQIDLDRLNEVASKIDDLGLAIERGKESIELIEAKLPSQDDVDSILEQVWRLAEGNGLIVKSFHSESSVPAALYMELPLQIVMEGQFDGYYEFLLELENLPRITRIKKMTLTKMGDSREGRPGAMRAEFTLSIFYESGA